MYTQKLYKNGNSIAVTIPKEILHDLDLRDGSQVIVKQVDNEFVVSPKKLTKVAGVDHKFMKMVDEFIRDHKDVLDELATK